MTNDEFKKQLIRRAFQLARRSMRLVDRFPQKRTAWIIADQLLRAITSIGANIIEGQAASSKKDFTNFLNHALKSANEAIYWLELAKDLDTQLVEDLESLIQETGEIAKILGSSINTLKSKL